jgi:hypothetical protein
LLKNVALRRVLFSAQKGDYDLIFKPCQPLDFFLLLTGHLLMLSATDGPSAAKTVTVAQLKSAAQYIGAN